MLRLPRARRRPQAGRSAARYLRRSHGRPRRCPGDRAGKPAGQRTHHADPLDRPRRGDAAARLEQATQRCRERSAGALDRRRRRLRCPLGLQAADSPPDSVEPLAVRRARPSDRRLRRCAAGHRGALPASRSRSGHARAAGGPRPHRPAARAHRDRQLCGRPRPRRLRADGRSATRQSAPCRTAGGLVARSRPLRRQRRLPRRSGDRDVALPRLGDQRLRGQHAVQPLHPRAACGRPPARRDARPEDRRRLQPAQPHERRRGRARQGVSRQIRQRPRPCHERRLARLHARLCGMPRPQV